MAIQLVVYISTCEIGLQQMSAQKIGIGHIIYLQLAGVVNLLCFDCVVCARFHALCVPNIMLGQWTPQTYMQKAGDT